MDPAVLTGDGFDSQLAGSADRFADLLHTVFAREGGADGTDTDAADYLASPTIGAWISHARSVLTSADPYSAGPDLRPVVDDLSVDPLTTTTPAALETVELLDAMVRVRETPDRATVEALTDTLTWTTDAPEMIRRTALVTVVAGLTGAGMPVAARGAVTRVDPPRISATTAILLAWDNSSGNASPGGLPPVAAARSARDVAVSVLARIRDTPEEIRRTVAGAVVASCPEDGLVRRWAHRL